MLSVADIKKALPANLRSAATQELTDKVNSISSDPEVASMIRDNFVSYSSILAEGRFKTEEYVNAVAYVTYKIMGMTNQDAYKRTFPARYQALTARGASEKEISAYVAAYNKGKLVNKILEQTIIPSWVLNQDIFQKAINTQAELMLTASSEKVRCEAANSILTHLKKPETKKVEIDLSATENSGMSKLEEMLTRLASQQQELIAQGKSTQEIAHERLGAIDGEMIDVTPQDPAP